MAIKSLKPSIENDTLLYEDSEGLVVVEKSDVFFEEEVSIGNYGLFLVCTQGTAQFEYGGKLIKLQKDDLFVYILASSVLRNFVASSDFSCWKVWFSRIEAWNLGIYCQKRVSDILYIKKHPKIHMASEDAALLESYMQLMSHRMKDHSPLLHKEIVRTVFFTLGLEIFSIMDRCDENTVSENTESSEFKKAKALTENFVWLVEETDGRVRKVDDFARQLNVSSKHLSRVLRETVGRKPSDIVRAITIHSIQRRLRFTDMTTKEIANELGFPNVSFFCKYFKENSGMTPLEFRLNCQK